MTVAFQELAGSPRFVLDENGIFTARREFHVAWSDWRTLVDDLRGVVRRVDTKGYLVSAQANFPDFPALEVSRIEVEPFDPEHPDGTAPLAAVSQGLNTYHASGARVRVEYKASDLSDESDKPKHQNGTFLSWQREIGVDVLSVPGRYWRWTGGPTTDLEDDLPLGIRIPVATHSLTWTNLARPPEQAIRRLRGAVNNVTFLGAPAGCVLFVGARITNQFQLDGSTRHRLEYTFSEKTVPKISDPSTVVGHNHFYYGPGNGGEHWFEIINKTTSARVYPSADLSQLFFYE